MNTPITLDTVVAQTDTVLSADLGGEIVMMSIEQGEYYGLDSVGSYIWELIAQPRAVSELCALLVEEFDVEQETCRDQVSEFLTGLNEEGLLLIIDASAV